MIYLELDDVLAIACEVLGLEVDALVHVTDLGLADSALAQPQAGTAEVEFHPSIEAKAAALMFGLARNHAFIDGNKRVAVLATLQFLNVNGHDLALSPVEEAYKTVVGVAAGYISRDDLKAWIRARLGVLDG
ncbi:MAG: type II toxin-antitoxin system death-on-curing family toxin [Acidimicrobiaceae bacterium]|nr:type II toxin-antitoxin system death-on-curing family toxin [Acidimicrobiaceae bacterium]MCY3947590.1 type II toxin-antitoxin system death-on-curing family toxin [Acidimicrobiaceae bacterium]